MNGSETEPVMDLYDYDYNSTCEESSLIDISYRPTVFLVICFMLFCFSLLGNTTVLWVLLRHMKLKSMTDMCLLNLALSDLMLAGSLPFWAYNFPNLALCKLIRGVYQMGFYSGTLFVTLMSVDRYLAIVHAVAAMQARTLRYGITASITIWIISVIVATPHIIFASLEIDLDDNSSQCQPLYPEETQQIWKMLQNFSENTVGLFVCLPIMIFCYLKILIVLSKTRNSKKDRAVKLIFSIVFVFVICWVPYNITVFFQTLQLLGVLNTCKASNNINSTMRFAEIIALFHCCINPVIYAFVGEKFRKSLRNVIARCLCWDLKSRLTFNPRDTTEKETSNTPVKSDY
ncbi:CX3C chemokine receptor 1 [Antennarius striatus]|uniref:CX3C chemokine receptor 1 n=1 Tax=Antennarius striatus TaxID=241820 RepID=UPI0035B38EC3